MKKGDFSKTLVVLALSLAIAFTVAILWVFVRVGHEPSMLVQYFFLTVIAELFALALIKVRKVGKEGNNRHEHHSPPSPVYRHPEEADSD